MAQQQIERRKFQRAKYSFPTHLFTAEGSQFPLCYTQDISEGGIRIRLKKQIKPSAVVYLQVYTRKDQPIISKGKVAWIRERKILGFLSSGFEAGIEFQEPKEEDTAIIKGLVELALKRKKDSGGF